MSATEHSEYEERPGRELLEYLEIPLHYPRAVLISFLAVMAVALVLAAYAPRKYRSSTLILVESKAVPPEYYVSPSSAQALSQRLATIRQVALSHSRLEEIVEELDPYPEMADDPLHVVVDAMRRAIDIRVYGADSFVFEYVNTRPEKAQSVTNMLAKQFIEDSDRLRERLTERALSLLQANLDGSREALEQREAALRRYEQRHWASLPDQLDSNLRMLSQLQLEQQTLAESLATLEGRRATLEGTLREGRRLNSPHPGGGGAVSALMRLRAEYESMRGRYTDQHPDMQVMRIRMQRLADEIASEEAADPDSDLLTDPEVAALRVSLDEVEAEIEAVKTRSAELDNRIRLFEQRVDQTPKAKQGLLSLSRDYQQLQEDYGSALKRVKDAEMAHRLEEYWKSGYFTVLDPAYLPGRPIWPYTQIFVIGGLVVGLFAGLLSALIADLLDRSVKSQRQLEEIAPAPMLVTIPRFASSRRRPRAETA